MQANGTDHNTDAARRRSAPSQSAAQQSSAPSPLARPRTGPLAGIRVLELAGIGPGPFGVMLLADLGADVIRVDRPGGHAGNPLPPSADLLNRNRRSIELDLKSPGDHETATRLLRWCDAAVECFRPGVAERLGFGPEQCLEINPALVYGRMTGWGQDGPLARRAGHDINYISIAGGLYPIGSARGPVIPLNVVGDFGGGGTFLALGLLAGIMHARATGRGQIVDAAIVDGTASLNTMLHAWRAAGLWADERESNMLDGGAHFYQVYETADGRHLSVGAIEPQFYRAFITGLGVGSSKDWAVAHADRRRWPEMTARVAKIIASKKLAEWIAVFEGTDACVTPVLTPGEAIQHAHAHARGTFIEVGGLPQPAPAPRFSATPADLPTPPPVPDQDRAAILKMLEDDQENPRQR